MLRARRAVGWMLAVLLVGCSTSTTEVELTDRLVGDWAWLDATGGIADVTRIKQQWTRSLDGLGPLRLGLDLTVQFSSKIVD